MVIKTITNRKYTAHIDDQYCKHGQELEDYLKKIGVKKDEHKDDVSTQQARIYS